MDGYWGGRGPLTILQNIQAAAIVLVGGRGGWCGSGFGWDSGIGWVSIAVVAVVGPLVLARARMLIICLLY